MEKLLSVIVPAYNVENYITKCLQSFADAEKKDRLEIIVVNDGSTDKTAAIAESYCETYPDIFYLYTKSNGGHGSAVNYGIERAHAKYFHVVDADDWMEPPVLDRFLAFLEHMDVDMVANHFKCVEDGTFRVLDERVCITEPSLCKKALAFDEVAESIPLIRIHALTLRTAFYKEHHIRIDGYRYYVDFEYTLFPIPYVETMAFFDEYLTMYRLGRNGQSVSMKSMQKNRGNHRKVIDALLHYYDMHPQISTEKRRYLDMGISKIVENQFQIYISMGMQKGIRKEMKAFDRMLKEDYPGIYQAVSKRSIWMLRKTDYWILPAGYIVYRIVKRKKL